MVALGIMGAALAAPLLAPHDPFDPGSQDLLNSLLPPAFLAGGDPRFLLGTDDQGRDLFSAILHGTRISFLVGAASVGLAMCIGVPAGLVASSFGGWMDVLVMRVADVQSTFPAILVALLIDGVARSLAVEGTGVVQAWPVLVLAIGLSFWVQYARTVRALALVELSKNYVAAARLMGRPRLVVLFCHVLPNVMGPLIVIAMIQLALAIVTEATLSFLGVGIPPTTPSLGTLIRIGNDFLFSGEWWITLFPGVTLAFLVISVNLLGDWLQATLDPRLH